MKLSELKNPEGRAKNRKRVGRGKGSGQAGTAGRGHKGQKARSGASIPNWFEGGQMPLQRRLPKRGFNNYDFRKEFQIVNLGELVRVENAEIIGPEELCDAGLIRSADKPVKILGDGEYSLKSTVKANAFSNSAKKKIEDAGGKAEVL